MYIDTSCLFAFYIDETNSNQVDELINKSPIVFISRLTIIEMLSSLKKRAGMNEISNSSVKKIYALFKNHISIGIFQVLDLDSLVFSNAEILLSSTSTPLRTLDALHLAVASENNLKIFTFDKTLIKAAKELQIGILD
ncbi:MAG: type II toxin-antitoxin system VapC family toxin [Balneola sp.]